MLPACKLLRNFSQKDSQLLAFFFTTPTTMAEAGEAIGKLAKRFHYQPKPAQPTPLYLNPGQRTDLSDNIGIPSGQEAKTLNNNLKRMFYRDIQYVSLILKVLL